MLAPYGLQYKFHAQFFLIHLGRSHLNSTFIEAGISRFPFGDFNKEVPATSDSLRIFFIKDADFPVAAAASSVALSFGSAH